MAKSFLVTLRKSQIGCSATQRATIQALGLKKIRRSILLADNPANRGQISKIQHMVDVLVQHAGEAKMTAKTEVKSAAKTATKTEVKGKR